MKLKHRIAELHLMLTKLETFLIVRDPGTALSADAYDGLRKTILQSAKNRRTHVSHLLSLKESLDRNASTELIKDRVNDFLNELGISYSSDTTIPDYFEVVEGEGDLIECVVPAVIDTDADGNTILLKPGKARRVPSPGEPSTVHEDAVDSEEPDKSTDTTDSQDSEIQDEVTPDTSTERSDDDSDRN